MIKLTIINNKKIIKNYCNSILLPGLFGEIQLLKNHEDSKFILKEGFIKINSGYNKTLKILVENYSLVIYKNIKNYCEIII